MKKMDSKSCVDGLSLGWERKGPLGMDLGRWEMGWWERGWKLCLALDPPAMMLLSAVGRRRTGNPWFLSAALCCGGITEKVSAMPLERGWVVWEGRGTVGEGQAWRAVDSKDLVWSQFFVIPNQILSEQSQFEAQPNVNRIHPSSRPAVWSGLKGAKCFNSHGSGQQEGSRHLFVLFGITHYECLYDQKFKPKCLKIMIISLMEF